MASPVMSGQVFRASTAEGELKPRRLCHCGRRSQGRGADGAKVKPMVISWLGDRSLQGSSWESGRLKAAR